MLESGTEGQKLYAKGGLKSENGTQKYALYGFKLLLCKS